MQHQELLVTSGSRGGQGNRPKISVTFTEPSMESIQQLADALDVPRGEVVRRLVDNSLKRMGLPR